MREGGTWRYTGDVGWCLLEKRTSRLLLCCAASKIKLPGPIFLRPPRVYASIRSKPRPTLITCWERPYPRSPPQPQTLPSLYTGARGLYEGTGWSNHPHHVFMACERDPPTGMTLSPQSTTFVHPTPTPAMYHNLGHYPPPCGTRVRRCVFISPL